MSCIHPTIPESINQPLNQELQRVQLDEKKLELIFRPSRFSQGFADVSDKMNRLPYIAE